jgi:chromosomal replication initiation ATPase DnaA
MSRYCRLMEMVVAAAFAVPLDELRAPTRRGPAVAFARQSAIYLAHIVLGLSYRAVGALFGRDHSTAAHACRLVEECRDHQPTDALLYALEGVCAELARGFFDKGGPHS